MNRQKTFILIFSILLITALILGVIIYRQSQPPLKVIFLDVGQGDAILVIRDNDQILIDGGADGSTLANKLGRYIPFWDRRIEAVIATHPDKDHIGGLGEAVRRYEIGTFIESPAESDSKVFSNLEGMLKEKNIKQVTGTRGMKIKIPGGEELDIISPEPGIDVGNIKETNSYSIVARLRVRDDSFIFTGDIPTDEEERLVRNNLIEKTRVLKVAHHGSKYSTTYDFLQALDPLYAIISVGKNSYGHPAPETLERLENHHAIVLQTISEGDIIFSCAPSQNLCQREK
jgi:competence protein ComEC